MTKSLKNTLTTSEHTRQIRCSGIVDLGDVSDQIKNCITVRSTTSKGESTTNIIINANKLSGDLFTYTELETAMGTILAELGITEYDILRVDLRFDSYEADHYQKYEKLYRYLISLMSTAYSVYNRYRTTDLITQEQRSTAAKNKYFEIEHYNKALESEGRDPAMSRLEERSKSWGSQDVKYEFTEHWPQRWVKALAARDITHLVLNDALQKLYLDGKSGNEKKWKNLTGFLLQYQYCIYSKDQLIELLERLPEVGEDGAERRAKNFIKLYKPEFFTVKDLEAAVAEIARATEEYFGN